MLGSYFIALLRHSLYMSGHFVMTHIRFKSLKLSRIYFHHGGKKAFLILHTLLLELIYIRQKRDCLPSD